MGTFVCSLLTTWLQGLLHFGEVPYSHSYSPTRTSYIPTYYYVIPEIQPELNFSLARENNTGYLKNPDTFAKKRGIERVSELIFQSKFNSIFNTGILRVKLKKSTGVRDSKTRVSAGLRARLAHSISSSHTNIIQRQWIALEVAAPTECCRNR